MPFVRASLRVFGAETDSRAVTSPPTITPYVMLRSEVLNLIRRIEQIYGMQFNEAFDLSST